MSAPNEPDTFARLERREWSKADVAKSYAQAFAKASDMVVPALVSDAGAGVKALDLCCGHGNVAAGLVAVGAEVTGLDFSPAMLELARATAPQARFVEGDAMALDFADQSFDAITIGFGIPHVPKPERVLSEARRVLRPGGRLAFSVWRGPEVDTAMAYVFQAIVQHGAEAIKVPAGPGVNDYAYPDIAFPALERAGFADCRQTEVASQWRVDDPGAPFDFFLEGTARGEAMLRPQPAEYAAKIRAAVVAKVLEKHGSGPVWNVPIPAVVTSAVAV